MDKNQNIGIILMMVMVFAFMWFSKPSQEEIDEKKAQLALKKQKEDSTNNIVKQPTLPGVSTPVQPDTQPSIEKDSLANAQHNQKFGPFSNLFNGKKTTTVLENDFAEFQLSSKGARIQSVRLKQFKTFDKKDLILQDSLNSDMAYIFKYKGQNVNLYDLYFLPPVKSQKGDTLVFVYKAPLQNSKNIFVRYSLPPKSYILNYDVDFSEVANDIDDTDIEFAWKVAYKQLEEHIDGVLGSSNKSGISYFAEDNVKTIGESTTKIVEENVSQAVSWFNLKQKFFSAALLNKTGAFKGAEFKIDPTIAADTSFIKTVYVKAKLDIRKAKAGQGLHFYYGPNDHDIMEKVAPSFEKNVYLGWALFSWINEFLILPIFKFLEGYVSNYGIIILILVFIIKLVLSPLSYKNYVSMAKMRVLKPELDELKKKYPNDNAKMQQEQMKLYGQFGISPLSGCVPMILQMPFLLAMFYFFPNSVELRQEHFLWSHDLSAYDDVIKLGFKIPYLGNHLSLFTILMTASTILYTWMNNKVSNVAGPMKNIGYIMPLVFFFILNSYPAGLTFYYFCSNIVTFSQQAIIKNTVDEDKIREKLEFNRKKNKNKKKSGWRVRLDDAMKAQQEQQKSKKHKKK